jgi:predicted RNA-binding protein with PUA-like domain
MRRTTPRIVYDLDQGPADEGPADKAPAADHELPATKGNTMHYLLKTEPTVYSFANLQRDKTTIWDGVTNPAAVKHLREMKPGSQLLIYHTGDEKAVVGTAKVVSVDASNPKTPLVKIQAATPLRKAVTLADIKAHKLFTDSPLVRQGRLSVVPLSAEQWNWITRE